MNGEKVLDIWKRKFDDFDKALSDYLSKEDKEIWDEFIRTGKPIREIIREKVSK